MLADRRSLSRNGQGFTLVEVLVVLTIILVLLSIGAIAVPRPSPERGAAVISSLLEQSRIEAISSGRRTRLLILNEPGEEQQLSFCQIVREAGADPSDATPLWEGIGTGTVLGSGVALRETSTFGDAAGSAPPSFQLPRSGGREGEGLTWISFSFHPSGRAEQAGGRIVICRAIDSVPVEASNTDSDDFATVIAQSGRPSPAFQLSETGP